MVNLNPFALIGANVTAPPAPGYSRGTRVTAPNGHYLDFASDVTWGLFADGQPWFISDGVAITARFPAGRSYLGNNIDGYTLNPTVNGPHGYDQRRPGYVAPAAINTITPRKLDVIVSVESEETSAIGGGNAFRDGHFKNHGQAWFTCLTRPPPAGAFSPPIHWPADDVNRLLRPIRVPDIDGLLSRVPNYSASGITSPPAWSSFATTINQPNAAWLHTISDTNSNGYEGAFPRGFTSTTAGVSNYGEYVASELGRAMMAVVLNTWSAADKREFLVRMCQHGNQWIEPMEGRADNFIGSLTGGHWQWHAAVSALWLDATNQLARTDLFDVFNGNFQQVFQATASHVANDFVRHTSDTKPYPWRERLISTATGTSLGLQTKTAGGTLADGPNPWFNNLVLTRVSDSDTARLTQSGDGSPYPVTAGVQASPVWAVSDNVYCVPGYTITAGMLLWSLRGVNNISMFNPSNDAPYINNQRWAGQMFLMQSMGLVPPIWENAKEFVALLAAGNYPVAGVDEYNDQRNTLLETQVWDAHWATASAVPTRF